MTKKTITIISCFLLILIMFAGCRAQNEGDEISTVYSPFPITTSKSNEKTYKVTFYSNDSVDSGKSSGQNNVNNTDNGSNIAKVDAVVKHESATPPNPETAPGEVFVKWNADFSDVTKDIEVHAVTEDISDKPNVIAVEGVYGQKGHTVVVPISLCGEINLAGIDMTVRYDKNALAFESVFNEDGALIYNADTPGEINFNYVSVGNTTADVDLCSLKFSVKAESGEYELKTQVNSIYSYKDENNLYTPKYTVINANVYVYQ